MQISRHWRLNEQRYRLKGVRYQNGEVSLQTRPTLPSQEAPKINPENINTVHQPENISYPSGERKG